MAIGPARNCHSEGEYRLEDWEEDREPKPVAQRRKVYEELVAESGTHGNILLKSHHRRSRARGVLLF